MHHLGKKNPGGFGHVIEEMSKIIIKHLFKVI